MNFWRLMLLMHRYVGIAIGTLILVWCLSGFVMMYVAYPSMQSSDRLQGLSELRLTSCCDLSNSEFILDTVVQSISVEMLDDQPIIHVIDDYGLSQTLDLASGMAMSFSEPAILDRIGQIYASNRGWQTPGAGSWIRVDQWTVNGQFNWHRPLRKYSNDSGQEWYVSSATGEVVQVTRRAQRFWNWLGAVPHWLYPTALRQHPAVWAQIVIWATLIGLFLTFTGILIGVKHYRWRSTSKRSPYRGWALWHHLTGLMFGIITLTWLGSGLLSMNPWGALESRDFSAEHYSINSADASIEDMLAVLESVAIPEGTVRIKSVNWLGDVNLLVYDRHGSMTRYSSSGHIGEIPGDEIAAAAIAVRTDNAMIDYLTDGDTYYYSHHEPREFPVYRLRYDDGERYYISASTGQLVAAFDASRKTYRWLFAALHRMSGYAGDVDALRARIPRDIVAEPARAQCNARLCWMKVGSAAVVGAGMNDQCVAGLHIVCKEPY